MNTTECPWPLPYPAKQQSHTLQKSDHRDTKPVDSDHEQISGLNQRVKDPTRSSKHHRPTSFYISILPTSGLEIAYKRRIILPSPCILG